MERLVNIQSSSPFRALAYKLFSSRFSGNKVVVFLNFGFSKVKITVQPITDVISIGHVHLKVLSIKALVSPNQGNWFYGFNSPS